MERFLLSSVSIVSLHGTYGLRRELPIFRLWVVNHFGNLYKQWLVHTRRLAAASQER